MLLEVRVDAVDAAEGVDEPGGRLLPHAPHARKIVGGIAAEGRVRHVVGGLHTRAFLDGGIVVDVVVGHAPPGVEHRHVGQRHQLEGVPIAGDDRHLQSLLVGLGGQRGQHVVRLETGSLHRVHTDGVQDLPQEPQLLPEDLRWGGAIGLVALESLVAEGSPRQVERHGDAVRLAISQEVDQHRGEAVHGVGHLP